MPRDDAQDRAACAREPIHAPGSIQPHGVLLVVDLASDRILQAAGDAAMLLGVAGSVTGLASRDILGVSLRDLVRRSGAVLLDEPTFVGSLERDDRESLTLIAHHVQGLTVLEAMPSGRAGSVASTLASIRATTERIGGASDMSEACCLAAAEIGRITGYDRVMVYRFMPDGSGSVIAEVKDPRLPAFLNHRYPESDIPRQARELYRRSAIRVIPDVHYMPVPLVPGHSPLTNQPLDMSHCALRSVSPVHIQYLKNMGVGASMSVSLLTRGELWGLIACHNTTPAHVPYETQEACRHVGQILSQLIRARDEADQDRTARKFGAARDAVIRALADADESDGIFDFCPALQALAGSDGAAVCIGTKVTTAGHAPSAAQVRQLAHWLEARLTEADIFVTDCLSDEWPQAKAFASDASGLLAVRLGGDAGLLMWFRVEQVQEVLWAGNPHKVLDPDAPAGTLNPRKSFETWRQSVTRRSRTWGPGDVESVQAFSPRATSVLNQKKVRQLNRLLAEANERLATLAATDGLTGIPNRRAFDERLLEEWARARRAGRPLGLIVLDLDFFKQYNDHFGHPAGDECLKQIAGLLRDGRRASDFAARVGGEEFALLLPEGDFAGALVVAETTRSTIEDLRLDHPKSPAGIMTASLGVACMTPSGAGTAHDLMRQADRALYEAKRRGRNRAVRL